jgi:uncharacterized ubiquitin-like protein YukD
LKIAKALNINHKINGWVPSHLFFIKNIIINYINKEDINMPDENKDIIEVVKMLTISSDPVKAEHELNDMIFTIQKNHDIEVHENLCGVIDPYKFMFAFKEDVNGSGDVTPSYGVLVIEGSSDYNETEKRINDVFYDMMNNTENPTSFINITRASEFMYIVFIKLGGNRSYPIVKIKTIARDPIPAGKYIERSLSKWQEDEGVFPYDKFMIDENHIMFLCDVV